MANKSTELIHSPATDQLSDFDLMRASKKRKRPWWFDHDSTNESIEHVQMLLGRMEGAAEKDHLLRRAGELATHKLVMLNEFTMELKKTFLHKTLLEYGLLRVIGIWLMPDKNGQLGSIRIRDELLKALLEIRCVEKRHLQSGMLGKVMMKLRSHPDETRQNQQRARELIARWARSIFCIPTNYKLLSQTERKKLMKRRGVKAQTPIKSKTSATTK